MCEARQARGKASSPDCTGQAALPRGSPNCATLTVWQEKAQVKQLINGPLGQELPLANCICNQRDPVKALPRACHVQKATNFEPHCLKLKRVSICRDEGALMLDVVRTLPLYPEIASIMKGEATSLLHAKHGCCCFQFHVGAYRHGPHKGFCRATMSHPNRARLLNCFVTHLHGQHSWTTTAALFNYDAPPHVDKSNVEQPNLITFLSCSNASST